jgi:hypothetical protein
MTRTRPDEERAMPEKKTTARAKRDKREGKAPSTQAGEYVHEEIEHVRKGKHGAKSAKQAIAIGLSKARRAGVKVAAPKKASKTTRAKAAKDTARGRKPAKKVSATRSRATTKALKSAGKKAATKKALSTQARKAASKRTAGSRSAAAKKAARTKGAAGRSAAAKKAARTRAGSK